ncbi:MAG: glycine cleavage T C-terminal barrel domain-containing protein [Candidatus Latescibacterota bacterium]|nr:glycine cleavage T C-terminal barrel domain-containing protein [Candidatus Latescibacterota bacterium]
MTVPDSLFPSTFSADSLPASYIDPEQEYRALREGCALYDTSQLSTIQISGSDHRDFLNRLSTNECLGRQPSEGFESVFTDHRGRIFALAELHCRDAQTLLWTGQSGEDLLKWLERYHFSEDVQMSMDPLRVLEVSGPTAEALMDELFSVQVGRVAPLAEVDIDSPLACFRRLCGDGVQLAGMVEDLRKTAGVLLARGAVPVGEEAVEIFRIESGEPRQGFELTLDYNPWEAGLGRAISLSKGCYIGQEVIARLDTYDKVKQQLVGLMAHAPVTAGATLHSLDGSALGMVTSRATSPQLGCEIALAYVRNTGCEPGLRLACRTEEIERVVTVASLPLVA